MSDKKYIVIVQCEIVKQRCSGYFCEKAFNERTGGFAGYPADKTFRTLYMTCGGCCGRATHRKLDHLIRKIGVKENIDRGEIVVHLSSCITRDNYHGPQCPHINYLKELIAKLNLDVIDCTTISTKAEERRQAGIYKSNTSELC
ncbi:MAG: CGGC domain-containing protein [Victivallaceae bacterium]